MIRFGGRAKPVPTYLMLSATASALYALVFTLSMLYQATVVGLSPLQLVLVGTVLEAAVFLGEVPTGIVADLYSRRLSMVIGYALIGTGFALQGLVPSFEAVLVAQVLWGVGYTFTSGARQAWITDEAGEERVGPVFVRSTQVWQVGTIAGVLLAGALGLVSVRLPLVAGGIGFVVLAVMLALVMPERGFQPTPAGDRTTFGRMVGQFRDGLALSRRRRVVRTLMLVSLVVGLASEAFDRLWIVHLLRFDFPGELDAAVWFAGIGLVGTLLSLATSLVANRVFKRALTTLHPAGTMAVLGAVQVLAVLAFALAGQFWLALAMLWLRQVSTVLAEPVSAAWLNRHVDSKVRATVLSFEGQLNAIGQVIGGPALGAVGNAFSVRTALLASAATLTPIVLLYSTTPPTRSPAAIGPLYPP